MTSSEEVMCFLTSDKGLHYTSCIPFILGCQEAQSKIYGQMTTGKQMNIIQKKKC